MNANTTIQTAVINECRERGITCKFFLCNGFQMQGQIVASDDTVLVVNVDGKTQLLYKQNISTISPTAALKCVK